jgi:hypothetical protein
MLISTNKSLSYYSIKIAKNFSNIWCAFSLAAACPSRYNCTSLGSAPRRDCTSTGFVPRSAFLKMSFLVEIGDRAKMFPNRTRVLYHHTDSTTLLDWRARCGSSRSLEPPTRRPLGLRSGQRQFSGNLPSIYPRRTEIQRKQKSRIIRNRGCGREEAAREAELRRI